mmetsp:Transcript_7022/g.12256  ORF Transcript_7022/g.12256 Transcript_7022/m.12256 type:complete len:237 (-) Transcript_7022:288-998(-)
MFKLCGTASVSRRSGPIVRPVQNLGTCFAYHGFYGKCVPRRHLSVGFVVAIMQNIGCCVENASYSMATKVSYGRKAQRYDVILNNGSQLLVIASRFDEFACLDPAIVRGLQQSFGFGIRIVPHNKHFTAIAMVAIQIHCDINIYDIALFKLSIVGDSMTNNFVDTCTTAFGESMIVERRRIGTSIHNRFMDQRVDFIRGDTRCHGPSRQVQNLSGELSRRSHFFNFLRRFHFNHPR